MQHCIKDTKGPQPIFVCGHPKSGTTLLSALLDGHSQVVVFPEETKYLQKVSRHAICSVEEAKNWLLADSDVRKMSLGIAEGLFGNVNYSDFNYTSFQERFLGYLESFNFGQDFQSLGDVLDLLVAAYAEETIQTDKKHWIEKSPGNEMYLYLPLKWYPGFRSIYVVRDPRDVYVSYNRKKELESEGNNTLSPSDFVYKWGMSIWAWKRYQELFSNCALIIRYEDLLHNPKGTITRVCRFLGIPYEIVLETPTKMGEPWVGNSMFGDKFSGISTKPIGRWRKTLSMRSLMLIEGYLGKEMRSLEYQLALSSRSVLFTLGYWMRQDKRSKRQLFGMLLRLYWSNKLPKRMKNIYGQV